MAYQLIPFVAGAVVGGLVAYLSRDKKVRSAAGELGGKVKGAAGKVSEKVSDAYDGLRSKVAEKAEAAPSDAGKAQVDEVVAEVIDTAEVPDR